MGEQEPKPKSNWKKFNRVAFWTVMLAMFAGIMMKGWLRDRPTPWMLIMMFALWLAAMLCIWAAARYYRVPLSIPWRRDAVTGRLVPPEEASQ
jgi:hypothetical protein